MSRELVFLFSAVVTFVHVFYKEGVTAENNLRRLHSHGLGEDKTPAFHLLRNILRLQKGEYKCLKTTGK